MPYQVKTDSVALHIRVSPNASRDEAFGLWEEGDEGRCWVQIRLRAKPDKGAANKALIVFLAKWLGLARSSLSLKAGHTARLKTVLIEGESADIAALLDQRLEKIENPE